MATIYIITHFVVLFTTPIVRTLRSQSLTFGGVRVHGADLSNSIHTLF